MKSSSLARKRSFFKRLLKYLGTKTTIWFSNSTGGRLIIKSSQQDACFTACLKTSYAPWIMMGVSRGIILISTRELKSTDNKICMGCFKSRTLSGFVSMYLSWIRRWIVPRRNWRVIHWMDSWHTTGSEASLKAWAIRRLQTCLRDTKNWRAEKERWSVFIFFVWKWVD